MAKYEFKPMLAHKITDKAKLRFPLLGTPKLDGIRCVKLNGQALCRSLKPVPNKMIRAIIERDFPDGVDGELIIVDDQGKPRSYSETESIIMSQNKPATGFMFYVFDYVNGDRYTRSYLKRMDDLLQLPEDPRMEKVLPVSIDSLEELDTYEDACIQEGYEGVCLRSPDGPYKFGRSTEREQWLLKLKRFEDGEAVIIGFDEKMHNANEATVNALGHTERSGQKAGLEATGVLGSLRVRDLKTECEFNVGSGFSDTQRSMIWTARSDMLGRVIKYKYQPSGAKDLPRFPTFLGFRDTRDL